MYARERAGTSTLNWAYGPEEMGLRPCRNCWAQGPEEMGLRPRGNGLKALNQDWAKGPEPV
eukprot:1322183-Alexandrium_andersonii.AAC.1